MQLVQLQQFLAQAQVILQHRQVFVHCFDQVVIDAFRDFQRLHGRLPGAGVVVARRHKLVLLHAGAVSARNRVAVELIGAHDVVEGLPAHFPVVGTDEGGIVPFRQFLLSSVRHPDRREFHVRVAQCGENGFRRFRDLTHHGDQALLFLRQGMRLAQQ